MSEPKRNRIVEDEKAKAETSPPKVKKLTKEERAEKARKARDYEAARVAARKSTIAQTGKNNSSPSAAATATKGAKSATIIQNETKAVPRKGRKSISKTTEAPTPAKRRRVTKSKDESKENTPEETRITRSNTQAMEVEVQKHEEAKEMLEQLLAPKRYSTGTAKEEATSNNSSTSVMRVTATEPTTVIVIESAKRSKDPKPTGQDPPSATASISDTKASPPSPTPRANTNTVMTPSRTPRRSVAARTSKSNESTVPPNGQAAATVSKRKSFIPKPIFGSPMPEIRVRSKVPPRTTVGATAATAPDPPTKPDTHVDEFRNDLSLELAEADKVDGKKGSKVDVHSVQNSDEDDASWHDSDEVADSEEGGDDDVEGDDDDDDDESSTGLNENEKEELRQILGDANRHRFHPHRWASAMRRRRIDVPKIKPVDLWRALGIAAMTTGLVLFLISMYQKGTTLLDIKNNITNWWSPNISPHLPCFIDTQYANFSRTEVAMMQHAPHCDPKKVKQWLPCPKVAICEGGLPQRCDSDYYELDENSFACIRTLDANETVNALTSKLESWSIDHKCSSIGNPYVKLEDADGGDNPYFFYSQLIGDSETGYDLKVVEEANRVEDLFKLKVLENDIFIGLHENYNLRLPYLCVIKKAISTVTIYTCAVTWLVFRSVLHWYWNHLLSAPTLTFLTSVMVFFLMLRLRYLEKQRREKLALANDIACVRQIVWDKLAQSSMPTASTHLRDQLVWELYETSKAGRNRLAHSVWPLIVADINADSRVQKSSAIVNGKSTVIWKWIDSNKPEPPKGTPTGSKVRIMKR